MKVKNKATGVVYSDFPDDVWSKVKDEKHVAGILIPVGNAPVPEEVKALTDKKEKEKATPTNTGDKA